MSFTDFIMRLLGGRRCPCCLGPVEAGGEFAPYCSHACQDEHHTEMQAW